MAVAHTEHTGSLDVFKDNGEEFRSFRSKSSIRRHGKGDKKSVVSLGNGLNVRVSFLPVFSCFQARYCSSLGEAGGELIKIIERPLLLELFHRILELSYELRTVDDFIVKYGTPRALTANALASTYNNCNLA